MFELSSRTIDIIAYSKLLLVITLLVLFIIMRYYNRPWLFAFICGLAISTFYIIVSLPLQKMWWGNNGDETFIISFLSQVLSGNPFYDFYYHELPNFYPPLYFWLTGLVSRFFLVTNAITASKIGVTITFFLWFVGTYYWQKIYWNFINQRDTNSIASRQWFWVVVPLLFFFSIDFNDIILKPYETLPALVLVLLIGMIAESYLVERWTYKEYIFFGVSGGLIFLSYYFWWFTAIPTLFTIAFYSRQRKKNFVRVLCIGAIMFCVAAIYIIPLFLSYVGGIENWQAVFFIPKDFSTFLPFAIISWRALLMVGGIIGLIIYAAQSYVRANIILLMFGFVYQFINIVLYIAGGNSMQAAKPFLFLGTASIIIGCAYVLLDGWERFVSHHMHLRRLVVVGVIIFSLPFWPMTTFIDDPVVRDQIEKDLQPPPARALAERIQSTVPDYRTRTWLSSGIPEINAYLPMHYFIAHNPHFSHPASKYSERLAVLKSLAGADEQTFRVLIRNTPIDALLFYKHADAATYPLFFWEDNYPNGGKEMVIKIPKDNISSLGWTKRYEDKEWIIYVRELE